VLVQKAPHLRPKGLESRDFDSSSFLHFEGARFPEIKVSPTCLDLGFSAAELLTAWIGRTSLTGPNPGQPVSGPRVRGGSAALAIWQAGAVPHWRTARMTRLPPLAAKVVTEQGVAPDS